MHSRAVHVARLLSTPVKGLRVSAISQVTLGRDGVRGDRRFFLVDARGRMVNGKQLGALNQVSAALDESGRRLTLRFPGGEVLSGAIEHGEPLQVSFFSRRRPAVQLCGRFSQALSEHAGVELRLVAPAGGGSAIDRGAQGAVTIISRGSLTAFARAAAVRDLDPRRFRMSVELAGAQAHEEDGWIGRELSLGDARVRLNGHVGRCLVTGRHPQSGETDLPTLELLRSYRTGAQTTEPLALGVYGEVLREGKVRVGDAVALL